MMATLASHVHPASAIAGGVLAFGIIAWYWTRLALPEVPETRRRIRRASLVVMVFTIPILVHALGFANHRAAPQQYAVMWAAAILLLLVIIFLAFLDVLNNLRIQRGLRRGMDRLTRENLVDAARRRHEESRTDAPSFDDGPTRDRKT